MTTCSELGQKWIKRIVLLWGTITALPASLILVDILFGLYFPNFNPSRQFHTVSAMGAAPEVAPPSAHLIQRSLYGDYNVSIETNRFGLRESKPLSSASEGDLFVVGDSFAMGAGVDESKRLGSLLEAQLQRRVFTIALRGGLPWGDTKLVNYAEAIISHTVDPYFKIRNLLVIVPMDSLSEQEYPSSQKEIADYSHPIATPFSFAMIRQWLSEHSSLYVGAQYILHSNNYLLIIGSKIGIIHPIERRSNLSTITSDLLEKTANQLQVIQSLQGGNVLFVIVPFFDQFLPNLATTQKNSEAIYDSFMGRLRERHINAINSLPFFRAEAVEHSLIFGHDLLWNDNAHLATARAIAERLK